MMQKNILRAICAAILALLLLATKISAHEAKDFDDSVLYKIDFEVPDLLSQPELKNQLRTFYTDQKEKYECLIPKLEENKEKENPNTPFASPITLLQPIFNAPSCSYRIEAYWSYEICHGHHIRQYHEEREGKNVKFQEYYLGKWNEEKTKQLKADWDEKHKNEGDAVSTNKSKYRTIRIDNTRYPYFEMEFTDGTMCEIINAPRTTVVRYVCYPHGKNEIYSFKEISSCNYEAIILTSLLCLPPFHPEENKEISIKCFNSPELAHKPISMLRQELKELQISEEDFPVTEEDMIMGALWTKPESSNSQNVANKIDERVEKILHEFMKNDKNEQHVKAFHDSVAKVTNEPISDITPLIEFLSGINCLTGGSGWWKYEFCYGRYVRQFHKEKNSEAELFLGYFSEPAHRQWISANPEKVSRNAGYVSLWHHYERGTRCDRTGLPREVDVKLTCTQATPTGTAVSMYLLEPKTCQYILVVESPIVCELIKYADEHGLVQLHKVQEIMKHSDSTQATSQVDNEEQTSKVEQIRS